MTNYYKYMYIYQYKTTLYNIYYYYDDYYIISYMTINYLLKNKLPKPITPNTTKDIDRKLYA